MITADLNLTVAIRTDDKGDPIIWGYHSPLSREVYEANFRLLRDTKVSLLGSSARHAFAARGDASLYLREAGAQLAQSREQAGDGGAGALLAELKRLTVVLVPGANGWDMLPIDTAIASGKIDADEWADAEASVVFFTSWVAGTPHREKSATAILAASLTGGSTTSLGAMEWIASLPTLTDAAISGEKVVSSVPS